MAEGSDSEGLERQLQSLLSRYPGRELRSDSERFCSDFRELVEEYASRWQVPLPQLRILEIALRYFSRASSSFSSNCDHMLHTLSSLALSIFELLLFFDPKDFHQEPLRQFTVTFQECRSVLAKHQNVHFLQVARLVQGGGPWASPALQAILSESSLPQKEVDGYISSELPVFFELRVHYLLSRQRVGEAMALARCCARHPAAEQHSFFLQVYLTWLYKTSQHDCLHREVADFNGKDAVHIICSLECEEKDELLLALTTAFLSQQLRRGDMHYLCELVLVWSKLHRRLNTTSQTLLQETHELMLSATNVNSIFPFIRAILQEVGEAGIQFCVELCANALESCLPCDVLTKTLIYKTLAALLPHDLEVCRACALLVFFLERTVESYKVVYLLYMRPDQEYDVDCSPIRNHVRFETLQILKKDLYFDPEFWNLIALRTNCVKLLSEKVVSAALEEIMEDKWISNYCTKDSAARSACHKGRRRSLQQHRKNDAAAPSKRLNVEAGAAGLNAAHAGKRRGRRGSRPLKEASSQPLRRSFWQLDRLQDNGEHRRTTRLSEKTTQQKRRIRTPRWLLEDSGTLEQNKIKRHRLGHRKHRRSSVMKRSEPGELQNNVNKRSVNSELKVKENGVGPKPAPTPQVILELSLPDNELMGTFTDDACSRQRGLPQVLLYRPTVKLPEASQPVKTVHRKEVILRARDAVMFVQQLHCYTRRQKGKGNAANAHGSVSTITRSSVQGSPGRHPRKEPAAKDRAPHRSPTARAAPQKVSPARELCKRSTAGDASMGETCEEPAVEMKVTIASKAPVLDKVSKDVPKVEGPQTPAGDKKASDEINLGSKTVSETNAAAADKEKEKDLEEHLVSVSPQTESCKKSRAAESISKVDARASSARDSKAACENGKAAGQNDINNISTLTLVTEMVSELPPEQLARNLENDKQRAPGNSASNGFNSESKAEAQHKTQATSTRSVSEQEAENDETKGSVQEDSEAEETAPESEESKLEYCCTFCNKEFKGSRVVAHAMFHYRRDECMFCRVTFKDDLLAMMHLSSHIEKLKRMKEKELAETKDPAAASKTPAKVRRPRKSSGAAKPDVPSDSSLSESRILRSNKPVDGPSSHAQQSTAKHLRAKPVHKLNGHAVKRKELKRLRKDSNAEQKRSEAAPNNKLREKQHTEVDSTATAPQGAKKSSSCSAEEKAGSAKSLSEGNENAVASQGKLCCPSDGCSWFTDVSKNRVALLYHALEDHHGELKPLELAFRVGNSKCSICMRVLWSFEHFRHHVERHRLSPRYPCLHRGCTARFKTGNEMRRHTRKHSPLQAECCLPGCSQLFICLWALNLHEREHYASKSARQNDPTVEKKRPNPTSKDADAPTVAGRAARKLKEEAAQDSHRRKHGGIKDQIKEKNENKDSNVLKNLSNKDTSAQPCASNLRIRQTLRKVTNAAVLSSSLLKRSRKLKHKLKKKQVKANTKGPKRRGRPRKMSRAVHDENTTVSQSKDAAVDETAVEKSQKSPARLPTVSAAKNKTDEEGTSQQIQDEAQTGETSAEEPKFKKPAGKPVKRSHVEHKSVSRNASSSTNLKQSVPTTVPRMKASSKAAKKKRLLPGTSVSNGKGSKKDPKMEISSSAVKKPAKRKSAVLPVEGSDSDVGKEKVERTNGDSQLPSPPATKKTDKSEEPQDKKERKKSAASNVNKNQKDSVEKEERGTPLQPECEEQDEPGGGGGGVMLETPVEDEVKGERSVSSESAATPTPPGENAAKPQKPKASKNSDAGKESKKRKVADQDDKKTVKKQRKKPKPEVQPADEVKAEVAAVESVVAAAAAAAPPSTPSSPGYTNNTNHARYSICIDTLKKYSKKPHLRVPPTVYMDEKYTAMPKRRKEMSFLPSPPEPECEPAALHRQRCANCFTSFGSAEELQSHVQLQKCSNLFGFDSDDED